MAKTENYATLSGLLRSRLEIILKPGQQIFFKSQFLVNPFGTASKSYAKPLWHCSKALPLKPEIGKPLEALSTISG